MVSPLFHRFYFQSELANLKTNKAAIPQEREFLFFFLWWWVFLRVLCQYISITALICKAMSGIFSSQKKCTVEPCLCHIWSINLYRSKTLSFSMYSCMFERTPSVLLDPGRRAVLTVDNVWGEGHGDKDWSIDKERFSEGQINKKPERD